MTPKVSVLVPIYNVEKYLRECLDSLSAQSLRDIEIICVNDGSTDQSLEIVQEYSSTDARFVVIDKTNSGYGDSLNAALAAARGDYVGIVESDDWVEAEMFAELYRVAASSGAEVVKSNYFPYYSRPQWRSHNKSVVYLVANEHDGKAICPLEEDQAIFFQQPAIWSAIYSRKFLDDNGIRFLPTPGASYQDTSFGFKVWAMARRAVFTRNAYLHYRRDNEASSVHDPGKALNVMREYAEIKRYLRERDLYHEMAALVSVCKWGAYRWNIDRLDPDVAEGFILLAAAEFRSALEEGEPVYRRCDVNQARGISELVSRPGRVLQRRRAQERAAVSVIITIYNGGEYLRRCLESVRGQSLADIEIVLIDDGSTDESIELLEEAYSSDPRVQLVSLRNSGVSAARNCGIEQSHGDYVTFVDCDDFYEPDSLERMLVAATSHSVDLVVGAIRPIFEVDTRTAVERFEDEQYYSLSRTGLHVIDEPVLKDLDSSVCNKLFVLDKIEACNIRFPVDLRYEDAYFTDLYCWLSGSAYFLEPGEPVYNYRRRPGSFMSETFDGMASAVDHLDVGMRLLDSVVEFGLGDRLGSYYLRLVENYLWFALRFAPAPAHPQIWKMFRDWLSYHRATLVTLDSRRFALLVDLIPEMYRRPAGLWPRAVALLRTRRRLAMQNRGGEPVPAESSDSVLVEIAGIRRALAKIGNDQRASSLRLRALASGLDGGELARR